jgi:hypothetical protein
MKCTHQGKCFGACAKQEPQEYHAGEKIVSSTSGKKITISGGMHGGNLVSKSHPFAQFPALANSVNDPADKE